MKARGRNFFVPQLDREKVKVVHKVVIPPRMRTAKISTRSPLIELIMKNKTALIVSLVVSVLVFGGGFMFVKSLFKPVVQVTNENEEVANLPPVDSSVKVDLKKSSDGKSVDLTVSGIPDQTDSIDYELNYMTGAGLPKGAIGKIKNADIFGKAEVKKNILLGTCSTGGKCTYDTGVTKVNLVLKFNITTGAKQFIKEFTLE